MNIVIILILSIIYKLYSMDLNYNKYKLKNLGLRFIVFKKKSSPIILKKLKYFYEKCYNKSISSLGEGLIEYNNLSEDDKMIIETILSLCY